MKTLLTLVLITFGAFGSLAQYSVIGIEMAGSLRQKYGIALERSFSSKTSGRIMIEGGYYKDITPTSTNDYQMTGLGIIPEFRYYIWSPKRSAPNGLFAGTALRYVVFEETYNQFSRNGNIINAGLDLGYKYTYKHFCIEALLGAGVGSISTTDDFPATSVPTYYSGLVREEKNFVRGEILVGYVFPVIRNRAKAKSKSDG